jgi:DNA-binding NtrC family response regulator
LRYEGFDNVSYFTDPLKALETVNSKAPDLLITDVVMLPLTGLELVMKMQKICPECKIILFSGSPSTSQLLEIANSEGYNFEVLAKPLHPNELVAKVRSKLGVAQHSNEIHLTYPATDGARAGAGQDASL